MRDRSSFHNRSSSEVGMSAALAVEAQTIVQRAAEPIRAGETVKAQMRRAWMNLGRLPQWRVRAAWYGEAGCWSAAAMQDLREREARWSAREEEAGREEARALVAVLSRFAAPDAEEGSAADRAAIAEARDLIRRLGAGDRA